MIRLLTILFVILLTAAAGVIVATLFRPPVHDGLWLTSLLLALAALGIAGAIAWRTADNNSPTTTETE